MKKPFPIPYCINVHPVTDLASMWEGLNTHVLAVKEIVAPDRPFPLSLYLGMQTSFALSEPGNIDAFWDWMEAHDCFIVGLNAFPFDKFHADTVKTSVYHPDWRSEDRLSYTLLTVRLLADLTKPDTAPTLTTVPGGWRPDWTALPEQRLALHHIAEAVKGCREINHQTSHQIRIAIEPEPGCAWPLFDSRLEALGEEICWCLDTCHAAVEFQSIENLDWSHIGRVQLSAAIECDNTPEARAALAPFNEPVYLHQTRAAIDGEVIGSWEDLGPALQALPALPSEAIVRTHYHVPLTWEGSGPLRSTRHQLTPAFFRQARGTPCEVETYTYSVLPRAMQPHSLSHAIADELQWAAASYRTDSAQGSPSSTKRKIVSPGLA